MGRVLLLTNASAGGSDAPAVDEVVATLRASGQRVDLHRLGAPDHGLDGSVSDALERQVSLDDVTVVVAGGDGTVHAVVAELYRTGRLGEVGPLAVVPMGTGNDLAGGAGIPDDPVAAARLVVDGAPMSRDLLTDDVGGVVVNAVHVGIGALASQQAAPLKPSLGPLAYPVGAVLAGTTARGWHLRVSADGREVADGASRLLMVGLAVGTRIGGGAPLAPDADPGDGWADLVVASAVGPLARMGFARALQVGEHEQREDVLITRAHEVRVSGEPAPVNSDGEIEQDVAARTWTVRAGAWSLLVPATGND